MCSDADSLKNNRQEHLCGAYTDFRELSAEDLALFNDTVVDSCYTYTPLTVSTQVVAGMNYKFHCEYRGVYSNDFGYIYITIFRPLQGSPEVTGKEYDLH